MNLRCDQINFDDFPGLSLYQKAGNYYRFNVDSAVLLKHISHQADWVIDLGCGCGILGLGYLKKWPHSNAILLDCQEEMLWLSAFSAKKNKLENRVFLEKHTIGRDSPKQIQSLTFSNRQSKVIVMNPPYFPKRKYKEFEKKPNISKQIAREHFYSEIEDWFKVTRALLNNGESCFILYPANRLQEVLSTALVQKLKLKELWPIESQPGVIDLTLMEFVKSKKVDAKINSSLTREL